ncbi:unnamed protein product, partial [Heterosigma akashiwo]
MAGGGRPGGAHRCGPAAGASKDCAGLRPGAVREQRVEAGPGARLPVRGGPGHRRLPPPAGRPAGARSPAP